jgi:hypothetical protein
VRYATGPASASPGKVSVSKRSQRLVTQPSGNRCAYPGCRKVLIAPETERGRAVFIGELAHICGERPGSARYDPRMIDSERNDASNLILLCLEHHTVVDARPEEYSVERLRSMKAAHEAWVHARLSEAAAAVTFVELEAVARCIVDGEAEEGTDLTLTAPREKLLRNRLSVKIERLLILGMVNSPQVGRYLTAVVRVDRGFASRLAAGFVSEYRRLRANGLHDDDLFLALHEFSAQGSVSFERQAAGLSVLTYLFEKCEVFER